MRKLVLVVGMFESIVACSGETHKQDKVEVRNSALAAPGPQPLVLGHFAVGSALNGIWYFGPQTSQQVTSIFSGGSDVTVANVDSDGQAEIVRGLFDSSITVFKQSGTSLFLVPGSFGVGDFLAAGDVDGDGLDEIFHGDVSSGRVWGFTHTGSGANFFGDDPTFANSADMAICDLNHDGKDEVIVFPSPRGIYSADPSVSFDGFLPPNVPFTPGFTRLACADLNNDGFDDLIVAHPGTSSNPFGDLMVITDPGLPPVTFFQNRIIPFTSGDDIAAGDLDGDGFAEVVVGRVAGSQSSGAIQIWSAPGKTAPTSQAQAFGFFGGSRLAIPRSRLPATTTTSRLPFFVTSIVYVPPGTDSEVIYGAGNTTGTRTEWTSMVTNQQTGAIEAQGSVKVKTDSFEPSVGGSTQLTYETSTIATGAVFTEKTTESIFGIAPPFDPPLASAPDHSRDEYWIVFGALVTKTDFGNDNPRFDVDLSQGTLERVRGSWLSDLSTLLPGIRTRIVDKLGRDITVPEAQQILALNPFVTAEPIEQNPDRFAPTDPPERTLLGGGTVVGHTQIQISGSETGTGTEFANTSGFNLNLVGLGLSDSLTIRYQKITSSHTAESLSASLLLKDASVCTRATVKLFLDRVFGTYLTIPTFTNDCQQQPLATTSFESLASWQIQNGTAVLSNQFVAGVHSFSVAASGWTPLVSVPLTSAQLRQRAVSSDLSKVSYALRIPTSQPNPNWIGASQMYISSPSANVYNAYLGQVELTPLPLGQFVRMNFTVPAYALHALSQDHADVTFTIVLNVNGGTSGWLIDDLRIGG